MTDKAALPKPRLVLIRMQFLADADGEMLDQYVDPYYIDLHEAAKVCADMMRDSLIEKHGYTAGLFKTLPRSK